MKRIRIGKDINIQWVLHAPAGVVLTAENLTIELKKPKGSQEKIDTFTLETSQDKFTVNFTLRGTAFSQLGSYTFTAWLNKGEQGQSVVDAVNAFTLVGSTQAEDDLQSCGCGCLNLATVDLQGDIFFVGRPGYSPTANVVKEGDTVTITITDKDGTTTATVKDGVKGDDGVSPTANVVKSGNTATITITDKNGISSASISDGADGNDGISPTVSTSKSNGVTTVTITDKNGSHVATIDDGEDGYSPSASVTQTSSGATISVTDKNGTTTAEVPNGTQGDPGVSPAVSIETIQGGHRMTVTDAEHPQGQSFDVMDGQDVTEIFWATYETTTYTEIATANNAGKAVLCWYQNRVYMLSSISNTSCTLATNTATYVYSITVSSTNAWSSSYSGVPSMLGNSDGSYAISSANYANYVPTMERMHTIINDTLSREGLTGWQDGYIDVTATPISDTINPSTSNTKYLKVEVNEGEVYCLNVKGGTASRAYAIADASKTPIASASVESTLYFYYIKIPAGGKYLYLHSSLDLSTFNCYRIKTAKDVENKIGSAVSLTFTYEDDTTATYSLLTAPSNS